MPPVAAAALGTAFAAAGAYAAGTAITASFLAINFAGSLLMSGLSKILSPKIDKPDLSSFASLKTTGYTQQFRQAVTDRRVVYGEVRTSGPIVFVGSTGNNEFLHMVIVVASHEIAGFEEFLINDESIPVDAIDGSGMVTSGRYANYLWIKTHNGTDAQTADPDLIAAFPGKWTTEHRGRGNAYMYLKFKFNQDVYPSGIPNASSWLRGKLMRDLRDAYLESEDGEGLESEDGEALEAEIGVDTLTNKWTPNIALMAMDNLTDALWGMQARFDKVDVANAMAAANTCDEIVTTKNVTMTALSADAATDIITLDGTILEWCRGDVVQAGASSIGGLPTATDFYVIPYQRQGTVRIKLAATLQDAINGVAINISSSGTATLIKSAEPRYHGGGILKMATERGANFQEILAGMGGQAIRTGGRWYLQAGEYRLPEIELTQSDLAGNVSIVPQVSGDDRFNRVQGIYIGNINAGNPSDYPVVNSNTYAAYDGEILKRTLDLSFTQRPQTAQRIAKIVLERSRQEIVFTARFKLSAFKVRCGDNFYFTMPDRYGWTMKVFECIAWRLGIERDDEGINRPYIEITARENAAAVYNFVSADDESLQDPAPNTDLPDPFTVTVVTGFSVTSIPVYTGTGDVTYKLRANWVAHENAFVREGGKYEIWYKPSDQVEFSRFPINDGSATQTDLFQAEAGQLYDLQIRAINNLGAKSQFTTLYDFVVGTTIFTDTEDWEFLIMPRNPADWENNAGAAEDWEV